MLSPDGVAPSRMVGVSASVNLPLHHKVQKFSSGTGLPGWSRKKGRKTVVVVELILHDYSILLHMSCVNFDISFYSARSARIASSVLATAIPSVRLSVCLSVCHTPVLC